MDVTNLFLKHFDYKYQTPKALLSNYEMQFKSRFFQNVYKLLAITDEFTTTNHPQTIEQV